MTKLPQDRMDQVVKRFDLLEAQMSAGPEPEAYVRMAAEYAELQPMVAKIRELRDAERERRDLSGLLADKATDAEMRELAEAVGTLEQHPDDRPCPAPADQLDGVVEAGAEGAALDVRRRLPRGLAHARSMAHR